MNSMLRIPSRLADIGIDRLHLSTRPYNVLVREGMIQLGSLDGLSENDLLTYHGLGVSSAREIIGAVRAFIGQHGLPADTVADGSTEPRGTDRDPVRVPDLPTTYAALPIDAFFPSPRLVSRLAQAGYRTLGDLVHTSPNEVIGATGAGRDAVERLFGEVDRILTGEVDPLVSVAMDPKADFLELLRAAGVPDMEREPVIIERLNGFWGQPVETLEAIGTDLGVTRERTRQLRTRCEERVRWALAWFEPQALRFARQVLVEQGGLLRLQKLAHATAERFRSPGRDATAYLRWLIRLAEHPAIRIVETDLVVGSPIGFRRYHDVQARIEDTLSDGRARTLDDIIQATADLWGEDETELARAHCATIVRNVGREVLPGVYSSQRWSRADLAEYVLQQEGAPLHFTEIATRSSELTDTQYHENGFNYVLNGDDRFVRVGAGDFGLRAWGLEPYGRFDEVIERYLREKGQPEHEDTIKDDLLAVYTVAPTTVTGMLMANSDAFVHLGGGFWGLADVEYSADAELESEAAAVLSQVGEPITLDDLRRRLVIRTGKHDLATSEALRRALYVSPLFKRHGTITPERFKLVDEKVEAGGGMG